MEFPRGVSASHPGAETVIPLHYFDDSPMFARITMYALMVFDEVLDPEKLRSSLDRLVRREGWRKLGARVRKGPKGLKYHIPHHFTEDRSAIAYTHVAFDTAKADHPLAARLPVSASMHPDRPAIVGDPEQWAELACGPESPKSADDYLLTDRPVTGLRIISFRNATLVTLHWYHVASDAMGIKAVVNSWVLMLQGRESEIPELHGFDTDPLKELGKHATERFVIKDLQMSGLSTVSYMLRNGYSIMKGARENRTVFIPRRFWEKLHRDALQELREAGAAQPFLSENDVLVAWWSRLKVGHLPADKPITIMISMSARRALEGDLLPPDRQYVSNCLSYANVLGTKRSLDTSLGRLAGDVRRAVNEQGTRQQIEAYHAAMLANAWPLGPMPVLFGRGDMHQIGYSNWTKANLYMADFSAAAATKREAPLYASFISQSQTGISYPEGSLITGRDSNGDYWLEGYRYAGLWENIENALKTTA